MNGKEDPTTIILRLNEDQQEKIKKLKKLTNKCAETKAILIAVEGYLLAFSRLEDTKNTFGEIRQASYSGENRAGQLITELLS